MKIVNSFLTICLLACLLLSSCATTTGGPQTWIDRPRDNTTFPLGPVSIMAHATDSDGIQSIEFYVNGQFRQSVSPNFDVNERLGYAEWEFTPTEPGGYRIEVSAIDRGGAAGSPAASIITVLGESDLPIPTEVPLTEPPATQPPTEPPATQPPLVQPQPSGDVSVSFYADPASVSAGNCATLHWDVEGTETVYWNGASVYYRGMEQRCPCEKETHQLQVVKPDGSKQDYWVTINVTGSCASPPADVIEPEPIPIEESDTTPPNIMAGANKSSMCPSSTVTSNVIAHDQESGIKNVYANWVLKDVNGNETNGYKVYSPIPSQAHGYTATYGPFDNPGTLTIYGVVENNDNLTTTFSHTIQLNIC